MKVAYVSHHSRPCYELEWFSLLPVEQVKILDTDFSCYSLPESKKLKYCPVKYRENRLLNRFFHSTAAHVTYQDFEPYLEDVEVIIVLEIFSSLARQFVEYAHRTGKKVWVLVYELIPDHPIYSLPPYRFYKRYVARHATGFVCVSEAAQRHLVRQGVPAAHSTVIYPGVDLDLFSPPKKRAATAQRKILFLAKVAEHKGIDLFLEAARRYPEHIFNVAGNGPLQSAVEEAAKELPNLSYLGAIKHELVPEPMREHDIYVMPAVDSYRWGRRMGSEQFGFSLVEAMACGMAVLTTDCGAIKEIVTEENVVVPQHDANALNRELGSLLNDESRLRRMQKNNPLIAKKRYDIRQQAARLAHLITS